MTYVLFIDLLGFASAVTSLDLIDEDVFINSLKQPETEMVRLALENVPKAERLYRHYVKFQEAARTVIDRLARKGSFYRQEHFHAIRSVVFSDSLFLAYNDRDALLQVGHTLITRLLVTDDPVPCRGGLAYGTFAAFDWMIRAGEGGRFHAEAPFLGPGVVRAYYAESRGAPGLRLLIHPSAENGLVAFDPRYVVPLSPNERNGHATYEANLLGWPLSDDEPTDSPLDERYNKLTKALQQLRQSAPEEAKRKYDSTLVALEGMRRSTL